jgi:O-antigen ligase
MNRSSAAFRAPLPMGGSAEARVAAGLVALLGCGTVLALAGAAQNALPMAVAGGAAAAAALVLLVAGGWVDAPIAIVLAIPLPAVYETDTLRIAAAAPATAAVLVGWVLRWGVGGDRVSLGALPRRALLGLGAALALATAAATHPVASARELVNLAVLGALLMVAIDAFEGRPRRTRATLGLLVAVAAVCGGLAVLETLAVLPGRFPRWGTPFYRAALGFGQPNGLGLFLSVTLPLAVERVRGTQSPAGRAAAAVAAAAIVAGLFATFSRGSWLALLGGSLVLLFTGDLRTAVRIWIATIAIAVVVDLGSGGALRDTFERTIDDWVIEQRAALMLAGVLMFSMRPLLGVGPGGFAENLDRVGAQIPQLWDYLPTPHNAYVQMAAESGIVGLAAFVVFLFVILRTVVRRVRALPAARPAARRQRLALLWSVAVLACAGMVVWPFAHGTGQAAMIVLAAALADDGGNGA